MDSDTLLEFKNIVKTFPGVRALDGVSMRVGRGEIHALVGENGAGKSTLMKVLSGVHPYGTYEGDIIYEGELCRFGSIHDSEEKGIVIIHQELALIPYMTIAENMFLGNERGRRYRIDWDETVHKAEEYMKKVGLSESPRTLIKDIGVGKQQLVEIAKALAKNVRLLILDEPTASLNENDSQKLLALMVELKANGVTSILISHKLSEVSQVADRITVIRDGATIETLTKGVDDIGEERIIKGMVGREMTSRYPPREPDIGGTVLRVENWSVAHPLYDRDVVKEVSFHLKKGEVLGISGLMGAGRTELAMSLFGRSYGKNFRGKLFIDGKEVHFRTIQDAIDHKLAYVTEDRKGNGLVLNNPISFNITLANLRKVSNRKRLDRDKERSVATGYTQRLRVKCSGVNQEVGNLSGGNQQKVLLSKWMFTEPDILILDEPTRGVDVGAKYEIYQVINDLAANGKSVLMISSEMPELLGMCDRIYVMSEGRMVGEFSREEASQEAIMGRILQSAGYEMRKITESMKKNSMLIALILVMTLFQILISWADKGSLFAPRNLTNLIAQNSYLIILATGMLICILTGGNIDLSIGSMVCLVAAIGGTLIVKMGMNIYLAIAICLAVGTLLGALQAFWIAYVRIPAFIVTLAGMLSFRGLAQVLLGGQTISPIPRNYSVLFGSFLFGGRNLDLKMRMALIIGICVCLAIISVEVYGRISRIRREYQVPSLGWTCLRVAVICAVVMGVFYSFGRDRGIPVVLIPISIVVLAYYYYTSNTVPGRYLYAMGGNENATRLSGINTNRVLFFAYTNMGFLAAVAALVCIARFNSAFPDLGRGYELDAIGACYIGGASAYGGVGTIGGTLIGTVFMGVLNNGMSILGIDINWQQTVKGMVLLAAVAFDVLSKRRKS